jgi:hypothetical protein
MKLLQDISDIDAPASTIIHRCKELIRDEIELEDGIWTMHSK